MRIKIRLNKQRKVRKFRVSNAVKKNCTRPRLSIFRTAKNFYAQLIDDQEGKTIVSAGSLDKDFKALGLSGGNCEGAAALGKILAEKAVAAGVKQAAFDRKGFKYHGRVKSFADAVRDNGLDMGPKGDEE